MPYFQGDEVVRDLQMAECDRCHNWYIPPQMREYRGHNVQKEEPVLDLSQVLKLPVRFSVVFLISSLLPFVVACLTVF